MQGPDRGRRNLAAHTLPPRCTRASRDRRPAPTIDSTQAKLTSRSPCWRVACALRKSRVAGMIDGLRRCGEAQRCTVVRQMPNCAARLAVGAQGLLDLRPHRRSGGGILVKRDHHAAWLPDANAAMTAFRTSRPNSRARRLCRSQSSGT